MNKWARRDWKPSDIVMIGDDIYRVLGCYLGAFNCVSMIGLEPVTERPDNVGGPNVAEMLVPIQILNAACVSNAHHYRYVTTAEDSMLDKSQ